MTTLPNAVIEPARVLIDGQELPGVIAEHGVSVLPGGHKDVNRVQVTFMCGEVMVEDSANYSVKDTQSNE